MQWLIALCLIAPTSPSVDGPTLLRRVIDNREHQQELEREYAFTERTTTRNLHKDGRIRSAKSETFLVTPAPGGEYRRLIEKNGQPLEAAQERREEKRFQEYLAEQLKETPERLSVRTSDKMKSRLERYTSRLEEALEVFDFEAQADENLAGTRVRVFRFSPKAGYTPRSRSTKILGRMEGRIWIDPTRNQIAKLHIRFRESLKFLGGIFGRVSEGSEAEAAGWLDDDVWLLEHIHVSLDARLYFLKRYRQEIVIEYAEYEKYSVSTRERVTPPPQR